MIQSTYAISRLRVIATLVIVAFHCCCPYTKWYAVSHFPRLTETLAYVFDFLIYDRMLPTFFMLSGMLYFAKTDAVSSRLAVIWKKFDRLIIPYCMLVAFCVGLPSEVKTIGLGGIDGHGWFLLTLFILFFISIVLNGRLHLRTLFFLALVMYVVGVAGFVKGYYALMVCRYFVFFVGGGILNLFYERMKGSRLILASLTLMLVVLGLLGVRSLYSLVFNITVFLWVSNKPIKSGWIKNLDSCSFGIYLTHHVVLFGLFSLYPIRFMYETNPWIALESMFPVVLMSSWLIVWVLKRKLGFKWI